MAGKAQINTTSNLELTAMRRVLNILQKLTNSQQRTRVSQWIAQAVEELNEKLGDTAPTAPVVQKEDLGNEGSHVQ